MIMRFLFILCTLFSVGMLTIWQQGQSTRGGYEVSRLTRVKSTLDERNKRLRIEVERLKSPDNLLNKVEQSELKLQHAGPDQLLEPENVLNQQPENEKEKERGESCRSQR